MVHELKTDGDMFRAVLRGDKRFEIRWADRDFRRGDILNLRETLHTGAEMKAGKPLSYTGEEAFFKVTHILRGPIYGLKKGWVIMSIRRRS